MYTKKEKKQIEKIVKGVTPRGLSRLNLNAAGIDISPKVHSVSVPEGRDPQGRRTRLFGPTTGELLKIAKWLRECQITTVAMESTGVYWIPLREVLEGFGFEVVLVHAPHFRNVPGKKTDISDSEWLQTLHSYGLLRGCYRPTEEVLPMRTYVRERQDLVAQRSRQIQKMQKALDQMNVLIHRVVSDISGQTGMRMIRAILVGERNLEVLAGYRDPRCQKSEEEIQEALRGNFLPRHLFSLELAVKQYDFCQEMIKFCDQKIEQELESQIPAEYMKEAADEIEEKLLKFRPRKDDPQFNLPLFAKKLLGVDMTEVDGINIRTAMVWISEIGWDVSSWETSSYFSSWLTMCPGNHKSGGVQHSGKTRRSSNRLAQALRNAANTLHKNQGPLGTYLRKMKAQLGKAKGITATAHKLARILYAMVKNGTPYNPELVRNQNRKQQKRSIKYLEKRALAAGFHLVPMETGPTADTQDRTAIPETATGAISALTGASLA
ncbi:MAG: IS110 family transposase [Gammaproteobacteria bacterium]|nr:IS110 family transposase [Gammaproteobacteria bacterium]